MKKIALCTISSIIFIMFFCNVCEAEEACMENPPIRFENLNKGQVFILHGIAFIQGDDGTFFTINRADKSLGDIQESQSVPVWYIILATPDSGKKCIYILPRVHEVKT